MMKRTGKGKVYYYCLIIIEKRIVKTKNQHLKYISVVSNNKIEIIKKNGRGKNE